MKGKRKGKHIRKRIISFILAVYFIAWNFMDILPFSGSMVYAAGENDQAVSGEGLAVKPDTGSVRDTGSDNEATYGSSDNVDEEVTPVPKSSPNGILDENTLKKSFNKKEKVILDGDISMDEALKFEDGKSYILDLNGHSIFRNRIDDQSGLSQGEVIFLSGGSTLKIIDSSSSDAGKIYGGIAKKGGGIIVDNGTLQINRICIRDNFATYGGGIYVKKGSVTMEDVTLDQNGVTEEGEGNDGLSDLFDQVSFRQFEFYFGDSGIKKFDSNNTKSAGGAIYTEPGTSVIIKNCNITGNKSFYGGGIYNKGKMTITGSRIKQNYAFTFGGGIYDEGELEISSSSVNENISKSNGAGMCLDSAREYTISDCNFKNNKSDKCGGAIACGRGSLVIKDTTFFQNEAKNNGGALWAYTGVNVTIKNVSASENQTKLSGGFAYLGRNLSVENCDITHNRAKKGGAVYMDNSSKNGRITFNGGRIYIYDNTSINDSSNNNIAYYSFMKIKIKGQLKDESYIGIVAVSATDLTEDYSDHNDIAPDKVFTCDSDEYTILMDEDYPEAKTRKLLKARNSGYKCSIYIDVTDDVDWWDYCYVYIYGKDNNGKGKRVKAYESSDIQNDVDHGDGYWYRSDINCGDIFPTEVLIETKFGTGGGWRDWEANVKVLINGVNCGNTHIRVADWGCFHRYTYVDTAASDYPYPANFDAEYKREIDSGKSDDGIIKLTAVDQYGVNWNIGNDGYTVENLSFPDNDKVEILDSSGRKLKVGSDLGRNHQSTFLIKYKTGSKLFRNYEQRITVRFVFPLKIKVVMDDKEIMTKKGYQSETVEIDTFDTPPGYYLSKLKKNGSSGSLIYDELTGRYSYIFGVDNDTITAVLKPITYTIQFDKNAENVKGTVTNRTVTYDKKFTFPTNQYKRSGYKFTGWNSEPDGTGTAIANKGTVINLTRKRGDVITFYAQWENENMSVTGSLISDGSRVWYFIAFISVGIICLCAVRFFILKKKDCK